MIEHEHFVDILKVNNLYNDSKSKNQVGGSNNNDSDYVKAKKIQILIMLIDLINNVIIEVYPKYAIKKISHKVILMKNMNYH